MRGPGHLGRTAGGSNTGQEAEEAAYRYTTLPVPLTISPIG